MKHAKKDTAIGVMPILILGLAACFLLVLITDSTRFFAPPKSDRIRAEFLLENLDAAVAGALPEETALSLDGSEPCPIHHAEAATAQPISKVTEDGRILLFPSQIRFCAKITLEIAGRNTDDGFLAFGNRRLLLGARIPLCGSRITGEGLLLSLTPVEE